jgi:hypothetical protein
MTQVKVQPTPINYVDAPQAHWVKSEFDSLVENKGYEIYHDKMMDCPCKGPNVAPLSTCKSCRGSGFFLAERVESKAVIQNMNFDSKFKDWSFEKMGTAKITATDELDITWMDRIILIKAESTFTERLYPVLYSENDNEQLFSFLFYEAIRPLNAFLFSSASEKHISLQEGEDYQLNGNLFLLNKVKFSNVEKPRVSLRYAHRPQFHVIDILRDLIYQDTVENSIQIKNQPYPCSFVGRRSHLVLNKENYAKNFYVDNTTP